MKISVAIIAKNEEEMLPAALKSAKFADEIVLVDDKSTDSTVAIAKAAGAKVFSRKLDGFATQKNYAATRASNDWVFILDADEEISPELAKEISALPERDETTCYAVPRLNFIGEKPMKHGGLYPDYQDRLFDKRYVAYGPREVHETLVQKKGEKAYLKADLIHHTYADTAEFWKKVKKYSKTQATEDFRLKQVPKNRGILGLGKEFVWVYIKKQGFADGWLGFVNATYLTGYKYLYYKEVKRLKKT